MDHIVVVGASLAGARAADSVRRAGFAGQVTVVGAEPHMPYQRPPLSKEYLAGKVGWERLEVRLDPTIAAGVTWRLGWRATGLDLQRRELRLQPVEDGDDGAAGRRAGAEAVLPFDGLIIATGCAPRWLPGTEPDSRGGMEPDSRGGAKPGGRGGSGGPLRGVHVLRTMEDSDRLRADLLGRPAVAVVGAGFIGSEVASTCQAMGLDVTILEALPVPLTLAVGEEAGQLLGGLHAANGVRLQTGVPIEELLSTAEGAGAGGAHAAGRRVAGVRLADGSTVEADVVVVGIGVRPAVDWLEGSGLLLDNGVACNEAGFARSPSAPGGVLDFVMAAGDVARWHHPLYNQDLRVEHWSNAAEQGAAAGLNLVAGPDEAEPFQSVPYFWSDQYGQKISFVGTRRAGDRAHVVEAGEPGDRMVVVYERAGVVIGALGVNAQGRIMQWRQQIAARAPLAL